MSHWTRFIRVQRYNKIRSALDPPPLPMVGLVRGNMLASQLAQQTVRPLPHLALRVPQHRNGPFNRTRVLILQHNLQPHQSGKCERIMQQWICFIARDAAVITAQQPPRDADEFRARNLE